eukprot:6906063-Pyramimonas_sp.AAC.1
MPQSALFGPRFRSLASRIGALLCALPASIKRHYFMFPGSFERVRAFISALEGRQMSSEQIDSARVLLDVISGAAAQADATFKARAQADWRACLTEGIDRGARD